MVGAGKLFPLSLLLSPRLSPKPFLLSFSLPRHVSTLPRHVSTLRASSRTSLSSQTLPGPGPRPFSWTEWDKLVELLTHRGYFERVSSNGGLSELRESGEGLTDEFVRVCEGLILFCEENPGLIRSLPKEDISVLVENVSPYLFKNGENSALRLKRFLSGSMDNVIQAEVAETVDVIKYILSYASKNEISNEMMDESVKSLLIHFTNLIKPSQRESPVQNVPMKRGDWICIKCKLKNFGRNIKCFECNELRPKRNLTGGEWDCPQCEFFNHGRNTSCIRCDCKKPAEITKKPSILEEILNKSTIMDNNNGFKPDNDPTVSQALDKILNPSNSQKTNNNNNNDDNKLNNNGINWESLATQRGETGHVPFKPLPPKLFSSNNNNKNNMENNNIKNNNDNELDRTDLDARSDEIMPVRKGENRFVVSKRKDRSLTSPPYKKRIALEQANSNNENSNSGFIPFVPFPPDYFAKKRENKTEETNIKRADLNPPKDTSYSNKNKNSYSDESSHHESNSKNTEPSPSHSHNNYSNNRTEEEPHSNNTAYSTGNSYSSTAYSAGNSYSSTEPLDMSEEAKAERWFKRAAQITDLAELARVPDADFPQIMPMRKGVNRFVVSKRRTALERRLSERRRNSGNGFPDSGGGNGFPDSGGGSESDGSLSE